MKNSVTISSSKYKETRYFETKKEASIWMKENRKYLMKGEKFTTKCYIKTRFKKGRRVRILDTQCLISKLRGRKTATFIEYINEPNCRIRLGKYTQRIPLYHIESY